MYSDFFKRALISGGICLIPLSLIAIMADQSGGLIIAIMASWIIFVVWDFRRVLKFDLSRPTVKRGEPSHDSSEGPLLKWSYQSPYFTLEADFKKRVVHLFSDTAVYYAGIEGTVENTIDYSGIVLPFETLSCNLEAHTELTTTKDLEARRESIVVGDKIVPIDKKYVTGVHVHDSFTGRSNFYIECDSTPKKVQALNWAQTARLVPESGKFMRYRFIWRNIAAAHGERLKEVTSELMSLIAELEKIRYEAMIALFLANYSEILPPKPGDVDIEPFTGKINRKKIPLPSGE